MESFDYYLPTDLADASAAATRDSAFKAAGIDLLDRLKERVATPGKVIDLSRLTELAERSIERGQGGVGLVTLGALTTLHDITQWPELRGRAYGALTSAAGEAATPQIRNRATLGGNLLQVSRCWYLRNESFACAHSGKGPTCLAIGGEHRYHAVLGYHDCVRVHPSSIAPALITLQASAFLVAKDGTSRHLPVEDLYPKEPKANVPETTLQDGEVLTHVQFQELPATTRTAFRESREKLSYDWATTMAAVRLDIADGRIRSARVVLGSVAPVPFVAEEAAAYLVDKPAEQGTFAACARMAFAAARPLQHNGYKVNVGQAVLIDALTAAAKE